MDYDTTSLKIHASKTENFETLEKTLQQDEQYWKTKHHLNISCRSKFQSVNLKKTSIGRQFLLTQGEVFVEPSSGRGNVGVHRRIEGLGPWIVFEVVSLDGAQ